MEQVIDGRPTRAADAAHRLHALEHLLSEAIIGLDLEGRILSWNPAAERIFGWAAADAVGRHISLIAPDPTDPVDVLANVRRARDGAAFGPVVVRRGRRDGTTVDVSLMVAPVRDDAGIVIGMTGVVSDVTEALRERRLLERLVAAGDALALAADRDRIAGILVEHLLGAFGAPVAAFFVRDGDRLRVLDVGGVSAPVRELWGDMPAIGVHLPLVWASESGQPVYATSEADLAAHFPEIADLPARTGLLGAAAYVPLVVNDLVMGVLLLRFLEERTFSDAEIGFLLGFAHQSALALSRVDSFRVAEAATADLRHMAVVEQARASELEAVIQAVGEPIIVCDRDGRVRLANQAAVAAFEGEVPATYASIRGRFEDADRLPALGGIDPGAPVEIQLRGTDRWLELTMYPIPASLGASDAGDPKVLVDSTILVLRDITAIRQAQELREAFIGVLSHELRTPITTIYGGSKVLAREGIAEATRREIAEDVTAESERLHRLVEDLLVLARAERGQMEVGGDPVLLQHLVPRVLRTETPRWPDATIVSRLPPLPPAVSGDETYVEQVLRNLVGNAAKYGGGTGQVEVVLEAFEDEVVVRVLDEGPGFELDEAEQLFELFYRAAKTSHTTSGAGIGLFVCRALVEAMGGRIWAHPRPAGGAEFGFALPVFGDDE